MIRNCFRTSTSISISKKSRHVLLAGRTAPSVALLFCGRVCVVARARSKPPTIPLSRARTLTRAINHQRKQEQHAVDSSLLAAMAASDESPGGDGTMQGLCARDPTPSAAGTDRSGPGANDPSTWHDRAIGGGGLRARTEPGANDPSTWRDRATNDGSTEESPRLRWALEVTIKFLDILLDALQLIERRTRPERMVSPV